MVDFIFFVPICDGCLFCWQVPLRLHRGGDAWAAGGGQVRVGVHGRGLRVRGLRSPHPLCATARVARVGHAQPAPLAACPLPMLFLSSPCCARSKIPSGPLYWKLRGMAEKALDSTVGAVVGAGWKAVSGGISSQKDTLKATAKSVRRAPTAPCPLCWGCGGVCVCGAGRKLAKGGCAQLNARGASGFLAFAFCAFAPRMLMY